MDYIPAAIVGNPGQRSDVRRVRDRLGHPTAGFNSSDTLLTVSMCLPEAGARHAPLGQSHDSGAFVLQDGLVGVDATPQLLALLTALKQRTSMT